MTTRVTIPDPPFIGPFTNEMAAACGFNRNVLRRWLDHGLAVRVAHGVYLPTSLQQPQGQLRDANFDGCFISSFMVSAQVHRIWTPNRPHKSMFSHLRRDRVHGPHCEIHDDLTISSVGWTAANLARYQSIPQALIPLDSAMRLGVSRDELMLFAETMKGWRGTKMLGIAICRANALSQSALESGARGKFEECGLPEPVLQHPVTVQGKTYFADFAWPDLRIIVETDGQDKYRNDGAYRSEKIRERELQLEGWVVLRCGWAEIESRDSRFLLQLRRLIANRRLKSRSSQRRSY